MPTESTSADRLLNLAGGHFSAVTLQRGRRYALEGRVRIKSVEERTDEIHVAAEVRGTQDEPYGRRRLHVPRRGRLQAHRRRAAEA